jgi:OmpA-OmpF porin, OOP family
LGPDINTAANEQRPLLLQNGKQLLFVSNRSGGAGGLELWITSMHDQRDDFSWEPAQNLTVLNTTADEFGPGSYEEIGRTVLCFNSKARVTTVSRSLKRSTV